MSSVLNPPAVPATDTEAVRDEWVRAVEQLVAEVEGWCKVRDWPTRRIPKRITEPPLGEYTVPALLIQIDLLKLMLEPVARYTAKSEGVVDLYRLPEYADSARVLRRNGDWEYLAVVTPSKFDPDAPPTGPDGDVGVTGGRFTEGEFETLVKLVA